MAAIVGKLTSSSRGILTAIVLPLHAVSWFIIFLTIPEDAPIVTDGTWLPTYVLPTKFLILFAAFFIGVGEAVYQSQVISMIGYLYPDRAQAAPAFAVFQFVQPLAGGIAFMYGTFLTLSVQLIILNFFMLVGSALYLYLDMIVVT